MQKWNSKIMFKKDSRSHTITLNHRARTYTIRAYENGKLIAKYRSYPQSKEEFSEYWTENDIRNFLRYSGDYYEVK